MGIFRSSKRPFIFIKEEAIRVGLYEAIILENIERLKGKSEDQWNDIFPFFPKGLIHKLIKELIEKGELKNE